MTVTGIERLFGREEVLQRLRQCLDDAESRGCSIGLTGEPGVGKSALQARIAADAETAGFTVLRARGVQSESQLPYAVLHQVLAPILPRASGMPAPQRESLLACFGLVEAHDVNPFFTSLAVLDLLVEAAADAPVLICLDDLQWMDRASVDSLAFVARRIAAERVVLLSTSRSESLLLGDDRTTTWIDVDGLPTDAAHALLRFHAPGLSSEFRDRIVAQAAGNPLALIEFASTPQPGTAAGVDDELPMTTRLERAFTARADELDPIGRVVVDVAALDDGEELDQVLAAAAIVAGTAVGADDVRQV
ncbi:MAG TPA: ATP-binding protein, partial [Kribbella sp.]|nr:ATP-binding protein [Kribbella sp.]